MHRSRHNSTAFTLIELILVLVLIMVMMSIVAPKLAGMTRRAQVDEHAAALLALLDQARYRAVQEAVEHRVRLDPEDKRCWIERRDPQANQTWAEVSGTMLTCEGLDLAYALPGDPVDEDIAIVYEPTGLGMTGHIQLSRGDRRAVLACSTPGSGYRILSRGEAADLGGVNWLGDDVDENDFRETEEGFDETD